MAEEVLCVMTEQQVVQLEAVDAQVMVVLIIGYVIKIET